MKTQYRFAVVALPLAIITFLLSRVIWPDPVGMMGPDGSLIPGFIFISAIECVAFGLGVAFIIFGWSMMRRLGNDWVSKGAFVAVAWYLVSWWPHDNMHRVNPMGDYGGLLRIEFIFHFTLIVGGLLLAAYFWRLMSRTHT